MVLLHSGTSFNQSLRCRLFTLIICLSYYIMEAATKVFFLELEKNVATKLEGGDKALVAVPLKKNFLCGYCITIYAPLASFSLSVSLHLPLALSHFFPCLALHLDSLSLLFSANLQPLLYIKTM